MFGKQKNLLIVACVSVIIGACADSAAPIDETISLAKGGNGGGNGGGGGGGGGEEPTANWTADHDLVITAVTGSRRNRGNGIYVANSQDPSSFVAIYSTCWLCTSRAQWTPDGDAVTVGLQDLDIGLSGVFVIRREADGSSSTPVHLFDVSNGAEANPAVSPDGMWLSYTDWVAGERQVFVRPVLNQTTLATGAPIQVSAAPDNAGAGTWASDSHRLVTIGSVASTCSGNPCSRGVLAVYDIDPDGNGAIDQIVRTDINSSTPLRHVMGDNPDWSPTAERVATWSVPIGGGPMDLFLFEFSDLNAPVYCPLTDTSDGEYGTAFSSDGNSIAVRRTSSGSLNESIVLITLGAIGSDGCPVVLSDTELVPPRSGGKNPIEYREIDWK